MGQACSGPRLCMTNGGPPREPIDYNDDDDADEDNHHYEYQDDGDHNHDDGDLSLQLKYERAVKELKQSKESLHQLHIENDLLKDKRKDHVMKSDPKELDFKLSSDHARELVHENDELRKKMRVVLESQANIHKIVSQNEILNNKIRHLEEDLKDYEEEKKRIKNEVKVIEKKIYVNNTSSEGVHSPTNRSLQRALARSQKSLNDVLQNIKLIQKEHGEIQQDVEERTKIIQEAEDVIERMPRNLGVKTAQRGGRVVVTKVVSKDSDLMTDDIILKIDDVPIGSIMEMIEELEIKTIGSTVKLDILRENQELCIWVEVITRASDKYVEIQRKAWGLFTKNDITPSSTPRKIIKEKRQQEGDDETIEDRKAPLPPGPPPSFTFEGEGGGESAVGDAPLPPAQVEGEVEEAVTPEQPPLPPSYEQEEGEEEEEDKQAQDFAPIPSSMPLDGGDSSSSHIAAAAPVPPTASPPGVEENSGENDDDGPPTSLAPVPRLPDDDHDDDEDDRGDEESYHKFRISAVHDDDHLPPAGRAPVPEQEGEEKLPEKDDEEEDDDNNDGDVAQEDDVGEHESNTSSNEDEGDDLSAPMVDDDQEEKNVDSGEEEDEILSREQPPLPPSETSNLAPPIPELQPPTGHEELDIENVVLPPPALQLEQTEEAERELKKQDGGDEDIIQPPPADDIDSELPAPPSEAERELKQQSEDDDVIRPPAAEDVDADLPAPPFPDLIENVNDKETDSDDSDDCISSNQGEKQSLPVRQISVSPPEEAPQLATESFESKDSKQDLTTSLSVPPTRKTFGDNDSEGGDARTAISENAPRLDMSHLDDTSSEEEDDAVI